MSKVCLVTGGARGIGRASAHRAAECGWDVAVAYREREDSARSIVGEIEAIGRRAIAIKADVSNEADVVSMFKAAEAKLGPITGLVNSAGIGFHNPVEALEATQLERMFAVNVVGLMLCCREAARRMSRKNGGSGGSIVNISSMAATNGGRLGHSSYSASKGAVDVFTMGFSKEVAPEAVRVNVVRPGLTDTDMIEYMRSSPDRAAVEASIPMKRFGRPEEVAEAVVWLLSEKASFVTGGHLNAGGGGFLIGSR